MNIIPTDPFMTEDEAAAHLGCSPATLKLWRAQKTGPEFVRWNNKRAVRYRLSSLEHFIKLSTAMKEAAHD
jgi:hypothetical protein